MTEQLPIPELTNPAGVFTVIPAKAGIHLSSGTLWIPAFAGMTRRVAYGVMFRIWQSETSMVHHFASSYPRLGLRRELSRTIGRSEPPDLAIRREPKG